MEGGNRIAGFVGDEKLEWGAVSSREDRPEVEERTVLIRTP